MGAHMPESEECKQEHDGDCGDQRRENRRGEGVVILRPRHGLKGRGNGMVAEEQRRRSRAGSYGLQNSQNGDRSRAQALLGWSGMSSNSFTNLMEQYGTEAEAIKMQEAREIARRKTMKKIKRCIYLMILVGIAVAGWMNRGAVAEFSSTQWKKVTGEVGKSGGVIGNGEKTKNKAKELQELAKKRNEIIDGTF